MTKHICVFQHVSWEGPGQHLLTAALKWNAALDIIKVWKEPIPGLSHYDALIILGGPHVSASNAAALEGNAADIAVPGEGERAMEEIIHSYFGGGSLADIPGIFWRSKESEIIPNPGRPLYIKDLDSLPFPAYDLISLPLYWHHQSFAAIPRRKYIHHPY